MMFETVGPASIALISSIFVMYTILKVYRNHRYGEILLLMVAFSVLALHSILHITFSILQGEQYTTVRQVGGQLILGGVLLAPLLILIAQLRISGIKFNSRYFTLFLVSPFTIGFSVRSYTVMYTDQGFSAEFQPSSIVYLTVLVLFWNIGEIGFILTRFNSRKPKKNSSRFTRMQLATVGAGILAALSYGIERLFISGTSRYYLVIVAVTLFFLARMIELDITLLVPQDFGITKILISEKSSGSEIFHWTTEIDTNRNAEDRLFTAAMSALTTLIWGMTGNSRKVDNLELEDAHIVVAESERFTGYLLAQRKSDVLCEEFKKVLDELEVLQDYSNMVTETNNHLINKIFNQRLNLNISPNSIAVNTQ